MSERGAPRSWLLPLPEWDPESLPGYAEAVAKVERGESLFPARAVGAARRRRSVEELTVERDRLVSERDRLGLTRPDRAAAMLSGRDAARQNARMDSEMQKLVALSGRIGVLDSKIARALGVSRVEEQEKEEK